MPIGTRSTFMEQLQSLWAALTMVDPLPGSWQEEASIMAASSPPGSALRVLYELAQETLSETR